MKPNKTTVISILFALLMTGLGITSYDLTFHADQRGETIETSAQNITDGEPLGIAELQQLKDVKQCEYQFIVTGEVVIQQPLKLDKISGVPCGCTSDLTIPFYLQPQKVTIKGNYKKEDILSAVSAPEGFEILEWTNSRIWFVSKKYCKEEAENIPDKPKASK